MHPPNSIWRHNMVMDRQCLVINSLMMIPVSFLFLLPVASVITGVGPFRITSQLNALLFGGLSVVFSAVFIASPIMAWRMYFIHSKNPRRLAARNLRIQRRWIRRTEARARGAAHTSFEFWCVQHLTRDVGRAMRLAGKALLYSSLITFVVLGVALYIVVMGGRSAVPSWLLTLLVLFFPISSTQSFYGMYFLIFVTAYLGKRLTSLGAMVIKDGRGPLVADQLFLD